MKAWAVIGSNYGDEGKGLITDYLCRKHSVDFVVRFNGGAQAGHTVVTPLPKPDGLRHVFHHYGSGTFAGAQTYLGPEFICNPILFQKEFEELTRQSWARTIFVHPHARVTTFFDMILNQMIEEQRGNERHGSCGVGINETAIRNVHPQFRILAKDMYDPRLLALKLVEICTLYVPARLKQLGLPADRLEVFLQDHLIEEFAAAAEVFSLYTIIRPLDVLRNRKVVFEGAQGLLLDQHNTENFPHVTSSNTGCASIIDLIVPAAISELEVVYVTRTYLTRHGAGPLPGEDPSMQYTDRTNTEHPWQGGLRFAPLDVNALIERCLSDFSNSWRNNSLKTSMALAVTHIDQRYPTSQLLDLPQLKYVSNGPTWQNVEDVSEVETMLHKV